VLELSDVTPGLKGQLTRAVRTGGLAFSAQGATNNRGAGDHVVRPHTGVEYDNFLEMGLKSTLCRVDLVQLAPGLKSTLRGVDFNSAAGLFWRRPVIPTAELN
jgi:hypothetical protein